MTKLIEYKLIDGKIPEYIEDGGYFLDGDKLIGVMKEGADLDKDINAKEVDKKYVEDLVNSKELGTCSMCGAAMTQEKRDEELTSFFTEKSVEDIVIIKEIIK